MRDLRVFDANSLWLLSTNQFNRIIKNKKNDFCLIADKETEKHVIDLFDKTLKGRCRRVILANKEQLKKFSTTHIIHVIEPHSSRGKFSDEHVASLNQQLKAMLDKPSTGTKPQLIISFDLDETLVFFSESWNIEKNFFNPHAIDFFREVISQWKNDFEIEIVALTARPQDRVKEVPLYLRPETLLKEFFTLAGIASDWLRTHEHVFYTGVEKGSKFDQLTKLYGDQKDALIVHFDDCDGYWVGQEDNKLFPHLLFVGVEGRSDLDDLVLLAHSRSEVLERRPPTPHPLVTDPRSEAPERPRPLTPRPEYISINADPDEDTRVSCCITFWKRICGKSAIRNDDLSLPLNTPNRPRYGGV